MVEYTGVELTIEDDDEVLVKSAVEDGSTIEELLVYRSIELEMLCTRGVLEIAKGEVLEVVVVVVVVVVGSAMEDVVLLDVVELDAPALLEDELEDSVDEVEVAS